MRDGPGVLGGEGLDSELSTDLAATYRRAAKSVALGAPLCALIAIVVPFLVAGFTGVLAGILLGLLAVSELVLAQWLKVQARRVSRQSGSTFS